MILNYFISSVKKNIGKTILLVCSIAIYFSLLLVTLTISQNLEQIASLPFKAIGVDTVVQKTGKIPDQMVGAIYPHSNGPIYQNEVDRLTKLDFVQESDTGLYFWYFDNDYFKDVFGVQTKGNLFANVLKANVSEGSFTLDGNNVLITKGFAQKNSLRVGGAIALGKNEYQIAGIVNTNLTGNIIPADIYMNYPSALKIAQNSEEMKKLFPDQDKNFVNVVLLKTKPQWKGDIPKTITGISKDYLVFSEKTFSQTLTDQIKLVSSFGQTALIILGVVLTIAYGLIIVFIMKTREKEIAILRMLGWKISDLRKQFLAENFVLTISALIFGNLLALVEVMILSHQKVSMEIPWELSAKPHFLPMENNINRVISSTIPVTYNWYLALLCSAGFITILFIISSILFQRIKTIKPSQFLK
ncbi:FtsX-like permease family protein [Patescibacteria group bacterium]|nr:FtsX-like permease family protein [Patescibacteria group bacterium]MCL5797343.1 FtsX-like permease family protein [Patescibacteria group bacterium]